MKIGTTWGSNITIWIQFHVNFNEDEGQISCSGKLYKHEGVEFYGSICNVIKLVSVSTIRVIKGVTNIS